jgi:hypothetical protein
MAMANAPRNAYAAGFGLVAASVVAALVALLLSKLGVWPRGASVLSEASGLFGHPVPALLRAKVPHDVNTVLFWVFAFLVLRRLWLWRRYRSVAPPASFGRVPQVLAWVALASAVLFGLAWLAVRFLHVNLPVSAATLGLPAAVLLAPIVFWAEGLSLLD